MEVLGSSLLIFFSTPFSPMFLSCFRLRKKILSLGKKWLPSSSEPIFSLLPFCLAVLILFFCTVVLDFFLFSKIALKKNLHIQWDVLVFSLVGKSLVVKRNSNGSIRCIMIGVHWKVAFYEGDGLSSRGWFSFPQRRDSMSERWKMTSDFHCLFGRSKPSAK